MQYWLDNPDPDPSHVVRWSVTGHSVRWSTVLLLILATNIHRRCSQTLFVNFFRDRIVNTNCVSFNNGACAVISKQVNTGVYRHFADFGTSRGWSWVWLITTVDHSEPQWTQNWPQRDHNRPKRQRRWRKSKGSEDKWRRRQWRRTNEWRSQRRRRWTEKTTEKTNGQRKWWDRWERIQGRRTGRADDGAHNRVDDREDKWAENWSVVVCCGISHTGWS